MLSDDSLLMLLSAIFIWLLLRAARRPLPLWQYAVMGLMLGLSITTKYSTALLPLAILPVIIFSHQVTSSHLMTKKFQISTLALTWGGTLLGASWWFGWITYYFNTIAQDGWLRGLLHPLLSSGPDESMGRVFVWLTGGDFTGRARPESINPGHFSDWFIYLFQTFWGVPILEHDPFFPYIYLLIGAGCFMAAIGLWQFWRAADHETRFQIGLLIFIIVLLWPFPLLRFFITRNIPETGQGRHILYPAAQAIPILLVLGIRNYKLGIRNYKFLTSHFSLLISHFLLLTSCLQLSLMVMTYPAPLPVQTTTFNQATISTPLAHDFGDSIRLLGYDFTPPHLTLFWQARQTMNENYRVQIQLIDSHGQTQLTWLSHPVNGLYPTRAWDKGDIIRDTYTLPMSNLPADNYDIQLNLLHEATTTPIDESSLIITQYHATQPNNNNPQLWLNPQPARQRQIIALTSNSAWQLLGPNNQRYNPVITSPQTTLFMVGANWPSGDYQFQPPITSPVKITVANDTHLYELSEPDLTPVEASFADQIKLIGYQLPNRRFQPGEAIPLTLYWQSIAPVLPDALTFAVLLDENQQPHGQVDRYAQGYNSPMLWAENEIIKDNFNVPIQASAPNGVYYLHVGLYELQNGQPHSLPLMQNGQATDQTSLRLGPFKIGNTPTYPPVSPLIQGGRKGGKPQPQTLLNQTLGDQITLLGYDLNLTARQLHLTLYWQAATDLTKDYTIFLHVRDSHNQTIAQQDNPPTQGRYPTSLWSKGDIITDNITLALDSLPPGEYTPVIGLYDFVTGQRLPVANSPANEIQLNALELK